jgi:hypothetical protein
MLRQDFLRLGALPALQALGATPADTSCILLMMVGGPSQLDTFDMKPDAPSDIRGPFRPIRTKVPGIAISEIFPRTARQADKFSLIRSMHHTGPAEHDAGNHLMQTGRLFEYDVEHPSYGCVTSHFHGGKHVVLPGPIGATGGNMPHGEGAGYLGHRFAPVAMVCGDTSSPARYGRNRFGRSCFQALRLVESGVRFVTVNMFETVFDELTWDVHGSKPFTPISAYRDVVGPMFDMAYASLLEDLARRGLLANTMVIAMGEFGRTPRLNAAGGRDHWTKCYTVLAGGGPLKGGIVVGSSDAIGGEPKDRPVHPGELAATIYKGLGIPLGTELLPGVPIVTPGVAPIQELFV